MHIPNWDQYRVIQQVLYTSKVVTGWPTYHYFRHDSWTKIHFLEQLEKVKLVNSKICLATLYYEENNAVLNSTNWCDET